MWNCGGILEIDDPGYRWAKFGSCVESCSVAFRTDSCLFRARYGIEPEEISSDTEKEETRKGKLAVEEKKKKRDKPSERQQQDTTGKLETEELLTKPEAKRPKKEKGQKSEGKATLSEEETKKIDKAVVEGTSKTDKEDEIAEKEGGADYDDDDVDEHYGVYDVDDIEDRSPRPAVISVSTDTDTNATESSQLQKTNPVTEDSDPAFLSPDPALQIPVIDQDNDEIVSSPVQLDKDRPPSRPPSANFEIYTAPWMPCRQPCNQPEFGRRIQVWMLPSSIASIRSVLLLGRRDS